MKNILTYLSNYTHSKNTKHDYNIEPYCIMSSIPSIIFIQTSSYDARSFSEGTKILDNYFLRMFNDYCSQNIIDIQHLALIEKAFLDMVEIQYLD